MSDSMFTISPILILTSRFTSLRRLFHNHWLMIGPFWFQVCLFKAPFHYHWLTTSTQVSSRKQPSKRNCKKGLFHCKRSLETLLTLWRYRKKWMCLKIGQLFPGLWIPPERVTGSLNFQTRLEIVNRVNSNASSRQFPGSTNRICLPVFHVRRNQ